MFNFYYQFGDSRRKHHRVTGSICCIGSARSNDLVLSTRLISKRHAELQLLSDGVYLLDLGSLSGCWVNRERIVHHGPLSELDEITIGDVSLWLDGAPIIESRPSEPEQVHLSSTMKGVTEPRKTAVSGVFPTMFRTGTDSGTSSSGSSSSSGSFASLSSTASESMTRSPVAPTGKSPQLDSALHESGTGADAPVYFDDRLAYWSGIVHEQLLQQMDLRRKDVNRMSDEQLRDDSRQLIDRIVRGLQEQIPDDLDLDALRANVLDESVGLGPLEQFLNDDSVTEIMVNNYREIFVEKEGRLLKSPYQFSSDRTVYAVIERIITPLGRRIDESSPIVDARLKDGSRVNAVIPPLALKGPSLTIRKFPKHRLKFDDLIASGSTNHRMGEFFKVCVEMRKNIIVSGGTGSGKTTLLNVLSNFIPDTDRIVTIEDAAELKLVQPNLVSLESRPPNLEGKGEVPIRDLVKNSLRMRPDRIVVGECRGGEALDMLQAMNTGHDGSLTTIHANNPRDVISRLEVLVLMAGIELPVTAIREQIASAVDLIIQQTRFPCGSRKVTRVSEVVGMESGTVQLQDIFLFKQEGVANDGRVKGSFLSSGFIPTFYEELRDVGIEVDLSCFDNVGNTA